MTERDERDDVPPLWIADAVRPHHANTFAEEWFRLSDEGGAMGEAFSATGLMEWPYTDDFKETPEQARYDKIANEISKRVREALKPVVMETFKLIATEVLDRERKRDT